MIIELFIILERKYLYDTKFIMCCTDHIVTISRNLDSAIRV